MTDDLPLAAFQDVDAYSLADAARRKQSGGGVIHSIKPQTQKTTFIGRALTARVHYDPTIEVPLRNYDGWRVRERAGPGDVVVLDGNGLDLTVIGGLAILQLVQRGATAVVANACIRDAEEIEELGFPVFSLGVAITSAAGHGFITDIGKPVVVQGVPIATGDVIAGSRGGVVVVPWDEREGVLAEARRVIDSDKAVYDGLRRGEAIGELWHRHKDLDRKS